MADDMSACLSQFDGAKIEVPFHRTLLLEACLIHVKLLKTRFHTEYACHSNINAPINVFPQKAVGGAGVCGRITPGELDNLKNWGHCDTILCLKSPGHAFKFRQFLLDFLAETSKVPPLCQSCLSNSWG